MLSHGNTPKCQIWYAFAKSKDDLADNTDSWWKYNFYMDAKGQGHTEVTPPAHSCAR